MKSTFLLAILAALTASPQSSSAAEPEDGIASDCQSKWSTDYEMQEYCRIEQRSAYGRFVGLTFLGESDPVQKDILTQCMSKWHTRGGYDYEMVVYCSEQQMAAYTRLYKRQQPQPDPNFGQVLGTCLFGDLPPLKTLSGGTYGYRLQIGDAAPVDLNMAARFQSATFDGDEYFIDEDNRGRSRLKITDGETKRAKTYLGKCH